MTEKVLKFTPGPWKHAKHGNLIYFDDGDTEPSICFMSDNTDDERNENDARLIAAAPELLDALRHLALEVKGTWGLTEPSIREAIGNTNYHCIQERMKTALDLIARIEA